MADMAAAQDPAAPGKPVKISARAFDVLVVLVRADGKAVSKASLLTQVWGNEIVEENNLQAQISALPPVGARSASSCD
jgi:DNA-binding winged helix-turn-helix (wHTH) protein